jgi:site-specific DNA recombinase
MTVATKTKKYKLSNILELSHYMKIVIDKYVEVDEDGNYLINVGYLRVSTDRQADLGYGLDLQENALLTYCKANDFPNLVLFIDDGYTGTHMDRPALKGIISYIQDFNFHRSNIRINTMVIPRVDRLGRTLLGTLQFIQDYIVAKKDSKNSIVNSNKEDINFISVQENYCRIDKENPQGKFLLMLFATLAEYDRDLIVQKLKDGRQARVASGKWLGGGITPYGYRYDKEESKLIVVPEEAAKIREIFKLYIEDKLAPQKIADRLGFKGDRIITQILKRKSLTGCIIFNGEEYKGEHEAIITLETWQEAQDELEKRSVHRAESNHLLSGLLVCGECGAKMRYQKWNKSGDSKLVCYSRQKSKPNLAKTDDCQNELYWASDIEDAVIQELFKMTYLGNIQNKKTAYHDVVESLQKELRKANTNLTFYYERLEAIRNGESDELPEVIEELIQELSKKIRSLKAQINSEEEKQKIARRVEKAKNIFRTIEGTWQYMTAKEKQSVCQELIDRIVIHKDGVVDVHLKLRSYLTNK